MRPGAARSGDGGRSRISGSPVGQVDESTAGVACRRGIAKRAREALRGRVSQGGCDASHANRTRGGTGTRARAGPRATDPTRKTAGETRSD